MSVPLISFDSELLYLVMYAVAMKPVKCKEIDQVSIQKELPILFLFGTPHIQDSCAHEKKSSTDLQSSTLTHQLATFL